MPIRNGPDTVQAVERDRTATPCAPSFDTFSVKGDTEPIPIEVMERLIQRAQSSKAEVVSISRAEASALYNSDLLKALAILEPSNRHAGTRVEKTRSRINWLSLTAAGLVLAGIALTGSCLLTGSCENEDGLENPVSNN